MFAQAVETSEGFFTMFMNYGGLVGAMIGLFFLSYRNPSRSTIETMGRELEASVRQRDQAVELIQKALSLPSPQPGVPTLCLLDHRHSYSCPGMIPSVRLSDYPQYTPYDPDLADIGFIEPVLVADDIKWKKVSQ